MFGIDLLYIAILVSAIISFGASAWTKAAFHKAKAVPTQSGMSGAEVAMAILRQKDIVDVAVVETQGFLSDHYNPMSKQLALSPDVFHGRSAASAGIAAHEVGHAIQHAHGYVPLQLRSLLVPAAQFGSMLGPWIVIAGIFMGLHRRRRWSDDCDHWGGAICCLNLIHASDLTR